MTRGTLKKPGVERRVRRVGERLVAVERRPHLVGPIGRVPRRATLAVGGTPVVSICWTDLGVREDVAELAREQIDFRRVELEMRQRGDGRDLVSGESRGHAKC